MFYAQQPGRALFHAAALTIVMVLAIINAPAQAPQTHAVVYRSKDVVVVTPASLPTLAQEPGIAFQLYWSAVMAVSTSTSSKNRANAFLCLM